MGRASWPRTTALLPPALTLPQHPNPCNPWHQVYGVLLFTEGRADEARAVLRQGVGCNPNHPQLCMEWALAEQAAGNLGAWHMRGQQWGGPWRPGGLADCRRWRGVRVPLANTSSGS